jgi:hypothetical protein
MVADRSGFPATPTLYTNDICCSTTSFPRRPGTREPFQAAARSVRRSADYTGQTVMGERIDQFCKNLRIKLTRVDSNMVSLKAKIDGPGFLNGERPS